MLKKVVIAVLAIIPTLAALATIFSVVAPLVDKSTENANDQFHSSFSFKEPTFVHPRIIEDLYGWISDSGHIVTEINITDAQSSNRYHGEIILNPRTFTDDVRPPWIYWIDDETPPTEYWGPPPHFGYRYLGRTPVGLTILHTKSGGGGTMVSNSIMFVQLTHDYGVDFASDDSKVKNAPRLKPTKKSRESIRLIGREALGDRWEGSIEIVGGEIVVRGRNLNQRCKEGGLSPRESVELSHLRCRIDPPQQPPSPIVLQIPETP